MLIKKSVGKKINQLLGITGVLFEKTNNLVFVGYNQSLQRENNFILFCIFNYVTYINSQPLNPFVGKFRSSQRKPSY